MPTEIELKVRNQLNQLVDLLAENDGTLRVFVVNAAGGGGTETVALDASTLAALETVSLNPGQVVALDAATLAALEQITAVISGAVALDAPTLAALETINAVVQNWPARQDVADDYQAGEVLADQTGTGAVLTFNFAEPVNLIVIHARGGVGRANPFGGVPAANLGIVCGDDTPTYVPITTSVVRVFAPAGVTVTVFGMRRA